MKRKRKPPSKDDITDALIKKAFGYDSQEIVEEYVSLEGEIKLNKKKVTTKNIPPDITALKILLDGQEESLTNLTDEELESEKKRLLELLRSGENRSKDEKR